MNIQQIQYVLAVVDYKNFETAAEKCFITQSTLSTMIAKLEGELGIKIFNRKTKPVTVTDDGEKIIERFRIIQNEIGILNNVVQEIKGENIGDLKIAVIPTIAPYLLPLILDELAIRYPKINISVKELTTSQIQVALQIREIDVGILAIPINDKEIIEYLVYEEPFMVYDCTNENLNIEVAIEELDYSKLCLLQEGHCLRTQVQEICELSNQNIKSDVNYIFESGSMESLLRITSTRKGITIIPYLSSVFMNESDKSRLLNFTPPVPVREVGIVTHRHFAKKTLLQGLIDIIKKAVTDLVPEKMNSKVIKPL